MKSDWQQRRVARNDNNNLALFVFYEMDLRFRLAQQSLKVLFTSILVVSTVPGFGQCKVEGIITFKKGDMVSRPDAGAMVYIIPKAAITKKQSTQLLSFLEIETSRELYLLQVDAMGKRRGKQKSEEMKLERAAMDDKTYAQALNESNKTFKAVINAKDIRLVTTNTNGQYEQEIPCGEYYILVNSNARGGARINLSKYTFHLINQPSGSVIYSKQFDL